MLDTLGIPNTKDVVTAQEYGKGGVVRVLFLPRGFCLPGESHRIH